MAAKSMNFNQLVTKLLADTRFRSAVQKNPAAALKSAKIKATSAQVSALKSVDWNSLEKVQNAFRAGLHPDSIS
jgi:hypothetical protein